MQVKCSCGKLLKVPDNLAGKTVRCPGCRQPLKVPAAAAPAPSPAESPAPQRAAPGGKALPKVTLQCGCGKTISAPASFGGRQMKCPACGRIVTVPGSKLTVGAAPKEESDIGLEPEEPPPAPTSKAKARDEEKESKGDYAVTATKCPNCRAELEAGAQFCVACGTHLATGSKVEGTAPPAAHKGLDRKTKLIIAAVVGGLLLIAAITYGVVFFLGKRGPHAGGPMPTPPPAPSARPG